MWPSLWPSLWPSRVGSNSGRNRLWVRFREVSDIYPMFIEPTITWVPSGFSGYIWLNTKIVLKNSQRYSLPSTYIAARQIKQAMNGCYPTKSIRILIWSAGSKLFCDTLRWNNVPISCIHTCMATKQSHAQKISAAAQIKESRHIAWCAGRFKRRCLSPPIYMRGGSGRRRVRTICADRKIYYITPIYVILWNFFFDRQISINPRTESLGAGKVDPRSGRFDEISVSNELSTFIFHYNIVGVDYIIISSK